VVSGRRPTEGEALAKELRALGAEVEFVPADVRNEEQIAALVDKTIARFGQLDVAVNNAGTEGQPRPLTEESAETYAATFDTNVLGVLLSLKHELRVMLPQKRGSIINLSSVVGHRAAPGAAVYSASKYAVEGLTRAAALEAAPANVRVNAVAPGPVRTEMMNRFFGTEENVQAFVSSRVPLNRVGTPEEIAETILFLASDKVPFITGQTFGVDGGAS
jgi:NAD(P)-dependent dehydrogenase (short-subunit alcohol dehydrogenase family)